MLLEISKMEGELENKGGNVDILLNNQKNCHRLLKCGNLTFIVKSGLSFRYEISQVISLQ